jgi:hypothetical protein
LRLGVGELGSIPGVLLLLAAFAVLVLLRFASLAPGSPKPETKKDEERKVVPMAKKSRLLCSAGIETAWAVGGSMLAGLPLLT